MIGQSAPTKNHAIVIGYFIFVFALIIFITGLFSPVKNQSWILTTVMLIILSILMVLYLSLSRDTSIEPIIWLIFTFCSFVFIAAFLFTIYYESVKSLFRFHSYKDMPPMALVLILLAILSFFGFRFLMIAFRN